MALPTLPDLQRSSPRGGHHAETHIAAALDPPAGCSPPYDPHHPAGYAALVAWASTWAAWTASGWKALAATAPGLGAGGAPTARPSSRWTGPTGPLDGARARPMTWTPRGRPSRRWPARPPPPQDRRRPGGDDPLAAAGPPFGRQGPHPGRQPAHRAGSDRPRWPAGPASWPAAGRAGHQRGPAAARPGASHADRRGQVRAVVGRRSLAFSSPRSSPSSTPSWRGWSPRRRQRWLRSRGGHPDGGCAAGRGRGQPRAAA